MGQDEEAKDRETARLEYDYNHPRISCRLLDHDALGDSTPIPAEHDEGCPWVAERLAKKDTPTKPCTCGEAGGLAGAHNPGARGCLANTDEEEERLLVAEVRARADKATEGPFDVHRYDNEGGMISYQLQQSSEGASLVLCAFDDEENPRAARDAEFYARARADVHRLTDLLVSLRANITWLVEERGALWDALRCVPGANLVDTATARMASLDGARESAIETSKETERTGERYSPSPAVLQRSPLAMALVSRAVSAHHAADAFEVEAADLRSQVHRLVERDANPLMVLRTHPSPTVVAGTPRAFWSKPMAPQWWTYATLSIPSGPGVSELAFLDVAHTYAAALRIDPAQRPIVFRVDIGGVVVDVEVRAAAAGEGGGR